MLCIQNKIMLCIQNNIMLRIQKTRAQICKYYAFNQNNIMLGNASLARKCTNREIFLLSLAAISVFRVFILKI